MTVERDDIETIRKVVTRLRNIIEPLTYLMSPEKQAGYLAEVDAADAALSRLQQAREDANQSIKTIVKEEDGVLITRQRKQREELEAEVDALRAKLARYGKHGFGCGAGIFPGANCTCGFAPSEPSGV